MPGSFPSCFFSGCAFSTSFPVPPLFWTPQPMKCFLPGFIWFLPFLTLGKIFVAFFFRIASPPPLLFGVLAERSKVDYGLVSRPFLAIFFCRFAFFLFFSPTSSFFCARESSRVKSLALIFLFSGSSIFTAHEMSP